jgi:hypothetical protein
MEYLQIELSLSLQQTRINQNAFISLNSRFKSNLILLEKDLVLFKIRPNLHESKRQWCRGPDSNYYEYNVDHLIDLGHYLPNKPPTRNNTESESDIMSNKHVSGEKKVLTDKAESNLNKSRFNSFTNTEEYKAKHYNSNFSSKLLTELRTEIQRRESIKITSYEKNESLVTTNSSASDSEDNYFDVCFYKNRVKVEKEMYYH